MIRPEPMGTASKAMVIGVIFTPPLEALLLSTLPQIGHKRKPLSSKDIVATVFSRYFRPLPSRISCTPCAMIFRKRDPTAKHYTHIFALFVFNLIYEFILPMHINDLSFAGQKPGAYIPCTSHFWWRIPLSGQGHSARDSRLFFRRNFKGRKRSYFFPRHTGIL